MTDLRRYIETILEAQKGSDTYDSEIEANQGHGTFNFPWSYMNDRGVATARFFIAEKNMQIDIITTRDKDGKTANMDDAMKSAILKQAWEYVKKA